MGACSHGLHFRVQLFRDAFIHFLRLVAGPTSSSNSRRPIRTFTRRAGARFEDKDREGTSAAILPSMMLVSVHLRPERHLLESTHLPSQAVYPLSRISMGDTLPPSVLLSVLHAPPALSPPAQPAPDIASTTCSHPRGPRCRTHTTLCNRAWTPRDETRSPSRLRPPRTYNRPAPSSSASPHAHAGTPSPRASATPAGSRRPISRSRMQIATAASSCCAETTT